MKGKTLLLLISVLGVPVSQAYGQINCANTQKLVCELPANAAVLATSTAGAPLAAAATSNAQMVSNVINSSIATQLTDLPLPGGSVGIVSLQQAGNPLGVPYKNLGPVLTDRPDTVGRHHIFAGFSYQHFNFNAIDGTSLGALPVAFSFNNTVQVGNEPTDNQIYYGGEVSHANFHLEQYVGLITYGLTSTTDVSIWRTGIDQYLRSSCSFSSCETTRKPFLT